MNLKAQEMTIYLPTIAHLLVYIYALQLTMDLLQTNYAPGILISICWNILTEYILEQHKQLIAPFKSIRQISTPGEQTAPFLNSSPGNWRTGTSSTGWQGFILEFKLLLAAR